METISTKILEIDLIQKYSDESKKRFKDGFKSKINSIKTHPKFKVGQIISFISGYYDNIKYTTEILGFNKKGEIFLLWDCFWFSIKDEPIRQIEVLNKVKYQNDVIQLEPLSKTALSTQLERITGDMYSDYNYKRAYSLIIHKDTGKRFKMPSIESENLYKSQLAWVKAVKQIYLKDKYKNIKHPFIYYHNPEQWRDGLNKLKQGGIVEMCKESFWHFAECVPPKRWDRVAFVCREAESHNDKGQRIYLCGIERDGKYFAQYGTLKQYDNKELFKVK